MQYDAFDLGFITTDDFTNVDILEATYPAIAKRLHGDWINDPAIPIVTGFLGKVPYFTFHLWGINAPFVLKFFFSLKECVLVMFTPHALKIAGMEIWCNNHLGQGW